MQDLMPGFGEAPNAHPLFLHFPLVLLPTALFFWVLALATRREDLFKIGRWLLYLAETSVSRGLARAELLWGALPNMHVGIGSSFSTNPHDVPEPEESKDVRLSALYNFNQETRSLLALAIKASVDLPSGVDSAGADFEVKALLTKSLGRLSFHFNTGYTFVTGESDAERSGLYAVTLGASYPVGAPDHTRTTLLVDVFTEQSSFRGEKPVYGAELGARHQLGTHTVLDAGVGTEFAGPRERSAFFFTAGLSVSF